MSKRKRKMQQVRRVAFAATWPNGIPRSKCRACGEDGPHYCPPSLGDEGFYICSEVLRDGNAVDKDTGIPTRTDDVAAAFIRQSLPPGFEDYEVVPHYMDDM